MVCTCKCCKTVLMNTVANNQPHEYFLHLFREESLHSFIAETNLLDGRAIPKSHLHWKPINHKKLLVLLGLTISMVLIIKRSMKIFWNTKDWPQEPTSYIVWSSFYIRVGMSSLFTSKNPAINLNGNVTLKRKFENLPRSLPPQYAENLPTQLARMLTSLYRARLLF